MKNIRLALATAMTVGIAGIAVSTLATPALAVSGGGCNGSAVRACVSVNNLKNVVADGYLNTVPSGCSRTSVSVRSNGSTVQSTGGGCSLGRITAVSTPYIAGRTYTSMVRVFNKSGGIITEVISPNQY
ncbi:hypothetical protein [Microtetraspora sp. NBRC 16547]|uniref:hypothetical protein n=1 Tax=Microtetraspora sp. NBRC 16547 TaxID=3030993 RepID=UPI00249FDD14|nr:hypothetical protein [Microtetraspora sp. NBRC 16547]GLW99998.1 hypothetical protein Misp02_40850 [Microtetraspora sp. NBRC 16547]